MTNLVETPIVHLAEQQCFIVAAQGLQARLEYHYITQAERPSVNFTHTFVPVEWRGQGIAERLVRHGLAWAKAEQLGCMASCSYVAKFLR